MFYNSLSEIPQRYKDTILHATSVILDSDIDNLTGIVLFGSCARLNINLNSDVDIAVETTEQLQDIRKVGIVSSEADRNTFNTNVDVVFASKETMSYSDKVLFKEIRKDGIPLWKDGDFTDEYKQLFNNSKQ